MHSMRRTNNVIWSCDAIPKSAGSWHRSPWSALSPLCSEQPSAGAIRETVYHWGSWAFPVGLMIAIDHSVLITKYTCSELTTFLQQLIECFCKICGRQIETLLNRQLMSHNVDCECLWWQEKHGTMFMLVDGKRRQHLGMMSAISTVQNNSSFLHFLLPPECSALARLLLWQRDCVAVCVSVTLMYCAQTTESIIMRLLPDCSPAILVTPYQTWTDSSRGSPSWGRQMGEG